MYLFKLTDTDTEQYFPALSERLLTTIEIFDQIFNSNELTSCTDYNGDFVAWLTDSIKNGFFEVIA